MRPENEREIGTMTCRICGDPRFATKDCCPTPDTTGHWVSTDAFEKLMYQIWGVTEMIPYSVVRDFRSDWLNGVPQDATTYLKGCQA